MISGANSMAHSGDREDVWNTVRNSNGEVHTYHNNTKGNRQKTVLGERVSCNVLLQDTDLAVHKHVWVKSSQLHRRPLGPYHPLPARPAVFAWRYRSSTVNRDVLLGLGRCLWHSFQECATLNLLMNCNKYKQDEGLREALQPNNHMVIILPKPGRVVPFGHFTRRGSEKLPESNTKENFSFEEWAATVNDGHR